MKQCAAKQVREPKDVELPRGTRQLIFSNVTTYGGGSDVWGRRGMEKSSHPKAAELR